MSAEILYEEGIGENRAAVVEDGAIAELHIERAGSAIRARDHWDARLTSILVPRQRGIVRLGDTDALLEPLPAGATEGALLRVEVVREAIPEPGRPRLPKVSALAQAPGRQPGRVRAGPSLAERLAATGWPLRRLSPVGPDQLEAAGWSEVLEEAATGVISFDLGLLTISLTPAMTVIDVDGAAPPAALALAGARAAAAAIRRHDITGSIGIDLPTVGDKAVRTQLGEIVDKLLPPRFERTAVNGFGFLQIVRRRLRPSTLELIQGAPVEAAALRLLRQAERSAGVGPRVLVAHPDVAAWLDARPALLQELARRTGAPAQLQPSPSLTIWSGYVDVRQA